jgi:hypothetical protein
MPMRRAPSSVKPNRHPPPVPRAPNFLTDHRLSSSESARQKPFAHTPKNPIFYRAISLIFIDGKKSPSKALWFRGKKSLFRLLILPPGHPVHRHRCANRRHTTTAITNGLLRTRPQTAFTRPAAPPFSPFQGRARFFIPVVANPRWASHRN